MTALRSLLAAIGCVAGFYAAGYALAVLRDALGFALSTQWSTVALAGGAIFVGALVFAFSPLLARKAIQSFRVAERMLGRVPSADIVAGALGLVVGLIISFLLGPAFSRIPIVGDYLPTLASLAIGYLGCITAVRRREDFTTWWHGRGVPRVFHREPAVQATSAGARPGDPGDLGLPKILDTSAVIDGRILDICQAGFIEGTLVVPQFVLDELRRIADSSDGVKRGRGRRGLEILNRIQQELRVPVIVFQEEVGTPDTDVDTKLVLVAQRLQGKVVTHDYNLLKVAQIHGIQVLNVNDLANAVKPAALPGEDLVLQVLRDGKEPGQGVGYLDDGTMVVIEGGRRHVGERVVAEVTSVLQTSAGRMIFSKLRGRAGDREEHSAPQPVSKSTP